MHPTISTRLCRELRAKAGLESLTPSVYRGDILYHLSDTILYQLIEASKKAGASEACWRNLKLGNFHDTPQETVAENATRKLSVEYEKKVTALRATVEWLAGVMASQNCPNCKNKEEEK